MATSQIMVTRALNNFKMMLGGGTFFWAVKRCFDILFSLALMPVAILCGLVLLILNPFLNPGPLFYTQMRVGRDNRAFAIYKFRTMIGRSDEARFATDESARITSLGQIMRDKRIDEIPQILNALKGEMSFIGPRPEQGKFVEEYSGTLQNYQMRHKVRPGISGLAQVELGYTSDHVGTAGKLKYDLSYIRNSGFRMEAYVIWRTLVTVFTGYGAK